MELLGTYDRSVNYRRVIVAWLGKRCHSCGKSEAFERLDVHHINGDKEDNRLQNITVLCKECHRKKHGYKPNAVTIKKTAEDILCQ